MMKPIPAFVIVFALALSGATTARAESSLDILKEAIKLTKAYGTAVNAVHDEESGKASAEKVGELAKMAAQVKARAEKAEPLTDEQKLELAKAGDDNADSASQILLGVNAYLGKKSAEYYSALKTSGKELSDNIAPVLEKLAGATLIDSHDRLMGDAVGIMNIMADALAGATDESTAKVASAKIKALELRTKGFQARADLLGEPDPQKIQSLMQKHMAGLMQSSQKLQKEALRIQSDPELSKLLGEAMKSIQSLGN